MSQAGEEPVDLDACTAVLMSVPQQVAERIESFLTTNGIACRVRQNTEMTPERLAEEYLRESPEASRVLDLPLLGPLLRGRLGDDLKAEIKVVGSEIPPVWDVLVRPEDLPGSADRGGQRTPELNVPVPGRVSAVEPSDAEPGPSGTAAAVGELMILCELPWDQAWALTQRLNEAGIPAAVMAPEEPKRDQPMAARMVPVGVRNEDLDRAQTFLT
jgi:hypothetical protein